MSSTPAVSGGEPWVAEISALRDALARERRAREEAERAMRFGEMFAGMLGHDLRNPLGAIAMAASYIARANPSDKVTRAATRILSSADRMARMIEQLLELSRLRAGGEQPLQPAAADLAELCARVKHELEAAHPGRAIALARDGSAEGTWDAARLRRVLANVVGNAVAYGVEGHDVTIRIDGRDTARVEIAIHNAGAIAPDTLSVLFEPFRGQARQHHTEGLGLGLCISQHIVRAHGGTIEAASSEADGTTIRIDLPRHVATQDAPATPRAEAAAP